MPAKPSPFIWYDLLTPDLKKAEAFYAAVVGWRIADSGMPGTRYSILHAGDVMVGGLMEPRPGSAGESTSRWHGYIYSADVDGDAARVKELGGRICLPPEDIPGIGRFAIVADPDGAVFNLFKPNSTESPTRVADGTMGHVGWRDLCSGTGDQMWKFYSGLFGWTRTDAMDMGEFGTYQMFATGEGSVGGMMPRQKGMSAGRWLYFFNTDAIDAARARAVKAGGTIYQEPMEVPGGQWIVQVRDPGGAEFGLVAPRR
jgi:predicted enzyme related to lactoylglutathione lyase